jgi:hypothetical protein
VFSAPAIGQEIDAFGGAASENDFITAGRVDEFRGAMAGGFEGGSGAVAQFVNAAVNVGIVLLVVIAQRIENGPRFLRGGGVIEVDQRIPVDLLVQNRKILALRFPIDRLH